MKGGKRKERGWDDGREGRGGGEGKGEAGWKVREKG